MSKQSDSVPADLSDALTERLSKIGAIANMLMGVDPQGMAFHSLSNTAWTISDLAEEAHDLLIGKKEVQS